MADDHIKLSPPLILTEAQADELVAALTGALDAVAGRLDRASYDRAGRIQGFTISRLDLHN